MLGWSIFSAEHVVALIRSCGKIYSSDSDSVEIYIALIRNLWKYI